MNQSKHNNHARGEKWVFAQEKREGLIELRAMERVFLQALEMEKPYSKHRETYRTVRDPIYYGRTPWTFIRLQCETRSTEIGTIPDSLKNRATKLFSTV